MSDTDVDVMMSEGEVDVSSMSNEEVDNYFKEAQQEELTHQVTEGESHAEERREGIRSEHAVQREPVGDEQSIKPAESSGEERREERSDQQLQENETREDGQERVLSDAEQRSYKAALREERDLRKQIQQELAEQREASKKMSEAFEKLVSAANPEEKQQIPSYEDDPLGHLQAKLEQANQRIEGLSKTEQNIQQQQMQQQEYQTLMSNYQSKATEFANTTPDFQNAYQHLLGEIKADYMAQGLSDTDASQAVVNDEIRLVQSQIAQNKNPAEVIYEMAKRRGYAKAETAPANNVESKKQDMERMSRGVKASRSINDKGVSPNHRLTLEEVANLSDDEFDKFDWDKVLRMG